MKCEVNEITKVRVGRMFANCQLYSTQTCLTAGYIISRPHSSDRRHYTLLLGMTPIIGISSSVGNSFIPRCTSTKLVLIFEDQMSYKGRARIQTNTLYFWSPPLQPIERNMVGIFFTVPQFQKEIFNASVNR